MAMTTKERSARAAEKRRAQGEEVLRLPVRAGTKAALAELMLQHEIEEMADAMSRLIHNAHKLDAESKSILLAVPRHEIKIAKPWRERLRKAAIEAAKEDADE